jgi:hypothetical protein
LTPTWTVPEGERPTGRYGWGGFTIVSNLDLHRLWRSRADADSWFQWRFDSPPRRGKALRRDDIRTRYGERRRVAVLPTGILRYQIDEIGLYEVRSPDRGINFYPAQETNPMRAEHFLLNAVLPIYAGLRGEVCLHASAVAREGWATVFAGPSGSGKSTRALEAIRRGGMLLGDDAVVVRRRGDDWFVYPAARSIRLRKAPPGAKWRSGAKDEWLVPSPKYPVPLAGVVVLDRSRDIPLALRGSSLLKALLSLQAGWVWGDTRTRKVLADRTAELCYSVTSTRVSPPKPTPPPVRSQTLPSGSSVGASYESGQGSAE